MKMAKSCGKVYLGYEEEVITEKNQSQLNYTVNKIGGFPNWPSAESPQIPPKCPLCGLHRPLIVQCYAPLDNSIYHRTLYVFACVSPNCWNQSESWLCIRAQVQDNASESSTTVMMPSGEASMPWCNGADEWDENDNGDSANGNVMNIDNMPSPKNGMHRNSDEDDESNSFELETMEQALEKLQVYDAHNANMSPVQGAVGAVVAPIPAAELERDEEGLVTVDPPSPQHMHHDLRALMQQTAELPPDLRSRLVYGPIQFTPKYIYVEEEWTKSTSYDDRVNDLLNKYTKENAELEPCGAGAAGGGNGGDEEAYEVAAPRHGDHVFHAFLTRLRLCPGQILRYSRSAPPLLGAPLGSSGAGPSTEPPRNCTRCGASVICELQLVPEFAEALRLPSNASLSHLHFLSVLIFTCSQSCWESGDVVVTEAVVFQPEVV